MNTNNNFAEVNRPRCNNQREPAEGTPEEFCARGLVLLGENDLRAAMLMFKKALHIRPNVPRYMSYYGLCWAMTTKNAREAVILCEQAVQKEFCRPELFCNLGKVYLLRGEKHKALKAFHQGLLLDKNNKCIHREMVKLGIRKPPVIRFLQRNNSLNKYLGLGLKKLGLRCL